MQGLSRNKRIQEVGKETARQTVEGAVKLPHFEAPQNDNERLLNYQYDFLVNGSQEAWRNLWELTSADRKSTRLNSSHRSLSRMPSSA